MVARDEARGDPFSVTAAIPGLIQRFQNGSEVTVVRGPSSPGIYRLLQSLALNERVPLAPLGFYQEL